MASIKPTEHTGEPRNRHSLETGFMTACALQVRRKDELWCWANCVSMCKKDEIGFPLSKINASCIKHLNVKGKTIKLLEDSVEVHLYDLEIKKNYVQDSCKGIYCKFYY